MMGEVAMRTGKIAARLALVAAIYVPPGCGPRVDDGASSTDADTGDGDAASTTTSGGTTGFSEGTSGGDGPADEGVASTETGEPPPACEHELNPAYFLCDPWVQDCPDGEKCAAVAVSGDVDSAQCVPLAEEPKGVGEPCTMEPNEWSGRDDCDVGSRCWRWGGWADDHPVCIELCGGCSDAPECSDGSRCVVWGVGGVMNFCIPECDPLRNDCPTGAICIHADDCNFFCWQPLDMEPPSHGQTCMYTNECEAGASCVEAESFGEACEGLHCCSRYCDPNDPGADAMCEGLTPGQSCVPLCMGGHVDVGVCGVR
jgi:hypothetical protein